MKRQFTLTPDIAYVFHIYVVISEVLSFLKREELRIGMFYCQKPNALCSEIIVKEFTLSNLATNLKDRTAFAAIICDLHVNMYAH